MTGLVRRMTLDRCLPQFLLRVNTTRGTNHWILIGFFLVCVNVLFITRGDIGTLAGVYTLPFLSAMSLFAIGNMLLKVKRSRLPRETRANWPGVLAAFAAVVVGICGNVPGSPETIHCLPVAFIPPRWPLKSTRSPTSRRAGQHHDEARREFAAMS